MTADPPVRKDGLCAVCQSPRKTPKGAWARAEAAADPFCSQACCRRWHNLDLGTLDQRLEATA